MVVHRHDPRRAAPVSGPPSWLAYAWVVSLWVAAGCVAMAGVAAVVDWVAATLGPRTDSLAPLAASQPDCDPASGTATDRASGPP